MAFREIVAPTVKELFIQQLEGMILSGELRPGDRLPTERELADDLTKGHGKGSFTICFGPTRTV